MGKSEEEAGLEEEMGDQSGAAQRVDYVGSGLGQVFWEMTPWKPYEMYQCGHCDQKYTGVSIEVHLIEEASKIQQGNTVRFEVLN